MRVAVTTFESSFFQIKKHALFQLNLSQDELFSSNFFAVYFINQVY